MHRSNAIALLSLAAAILGLGASSCAASDSQAGPKAPNAFARRAAFDLDCPAEQLGYVPIKTSTPRTYGVVGCNKRATYVEMCSIAMYGLLQEQSCQWTMSGPIQAQTPAPPPVAPATSSPAAPTPAPTPAPAAATTAQ